MRRAAPITVSLLLALALSACGDDSVEPVAEPTTAPPTASPTGPPTTAPDGFEHPTGADEVVVSIEQQGGFLPVEAIFSRVPSLLVTGDGRQFTPGPQIAIYPGPLLPNIQVADIGEDGVQQLLTLADEHGLLQERAYESPTNVADAPDTVVTIRVGGETIVHRAYALGLEDGLDDSGEPIEDDARWQLADFVAEATAVTAETRSFEPQAYLVRALPVDDLSAFDIEPTILPWPVDVAVDLATADCVEIAADAIGDTFAEANQLTFFEQGDVIYQLAVKPQLPGASC